MTQQYPPQLLALAAFSGVAWSLLGIAYRAGQLRGVSPVQVALGVATVGAISFGLDARAVPMAQVPALVWWLAAATGLGQFICLKLMRPALDRGPLSPLWCTINLAFVVAVVYARLFLGEQIAPLALAGLAAAIGCVVVASLGQHQTTPSGAQRGASDYLIYGGLLLLILLSNSLWLTCIKYLSAAHLPSGATLMQAYGSVFSAAVYGGLGLLIVGDLLIVRQPIKVRALLATGGLGAVGSILGVWALARAGALPAAVVFTINCTLSLLFAALVSAFAMGGKRTPIWYGTVLLAIAAVLLVNAPGFLR